MKHKTEHNIANNKPSKRKYIIAAGALLLLIITVFVYDLLIYEPKPDPASEKIICVAAAKQLGRKSIFHTLLRRNTNIQEAQIN